MGSGALRNVKRHVALHAAPFALWLACAALASQSATACPLHEQPQPHTLILALDGIPYRVIEQAREQGAFADWPATSRLISPFPTVTNVSFTVMLQPFGVAPAGGYEVQHFDLERNRVVGATPIGYQKRSFAWRDAFDVMDRSFSSKMTVYVIPGHKSRKELAMIERELLATTRELALAHLASSDALQHLRGDRGTLRFLTELAPWLAHLKQEHVEQLGCPLRVVMLSDHGNGKGKVRGASGFRRLLRQAGLRVTEQLGGPDDVVAPTFGMVSYGALFMQPERAEAAARAVAVHPAVDVAAWRSGPSELSLVSRDGDARIAWRDTATERLFSYSVQGQDPLQLGEVRRRMATASMLDREGYGSEQDWFQQSGLELYPDPLRRLVDAFTSDHVQNPATVLFSLAPGTAWGWRSAQLSCWLAGGRLEGTHGGLDRESSLGFFLTDDPALAAASFVRAEQALADLRLALSWQRAASSVAPRRSSVDRDR